MMDYSKAADEFKDVLIEEYLKKHPGISRSEIMTRTINGRVIIDTINNVFKHAAGRKTFQDTKEQNKIKDLLASGDQRLNASVLSINTCRNYVQWLYRSLTKVFGEKERDAELVSLKRKEDACGKLALTAHEAKQKLVAMMNEKVKAASSLARTLMQETLHAVAELLKCQASIYKREVELGSQVSKFMRDFIESSISIAKALVKPSTINAMAKAYQILKNETLDISKIDSADNIKKLKLAVGELEEQLEKRREDLEAIKKMIDFVEDVLAAAGELQKMEKPPEPEKVSARRMAFTTRSNRR
ncbi:MAG: hypothetical protein C4527_11425 [Candidatus Omnitrophota bacterium]|jgi:uncharacterized protein involved in tolerance to divalent cations|nr:MAG: hypothetical protein C4527_11425 [Candidatus Omnitrophota bacterium]